MDRTTRRCGRSQALSGPSALLRSPHGVALVLVLSLARGAAADARPEIAAVGVGPAVERALRIALGDWRVTIEPVPGASPSATMPLAADEARAIAEARGADAVVWISEAGGAHALWIYDRREGRVTSRPLAGGPSFDDVTAAAVALSVKTLLGTSHVAPPAQRFGAHPARASAFRLESTIGGRHEAVRGQGVDLRLGLGASWSPSLLAHRLAIGVAARVGPGVGASGPGFRGSFRETSLSLSGRLRLPVGTLATVEAALGASLLLTGIEGTAATSRQVDVARTNPSIDAGVAGDLAITRSLRVGLGLRGSFLLRHQRYEVHGAPVVDLSPATLELEARTIVGLDGGVP